MKIKILTLLLMTLIAWGLNRMGIPQTFRIPVLILIFVTFFFSGILIVLSSNLNPKTLDRYRKGMIPTAIGGIVVGILFYRVETLIFFISNFSFTICLLGLHILYFSFKENKFSPINATITETYVLESSRDSEIWVELLLTWENGGRTCNRKFGKRFPFDENTASLEDAIQEKFDAYEEGTEIPVWIHPLYPGYCTLSKTSRKGFAQAFFGFVFTILPNLFFQALPVYYPVIFLISGPLIFLLSKDWVEMTFDVQAALRLPQINPEECASPPHQWYPKRLIKQRTPEMLSLGFTPFVSLTTPEYRKCRYEEYEIFFLAPDRKAVGIIGGFWSSRGFIFGLIPAIHEHSGGVYIRSHLKNGLPLITKYNRFSETEEINEYPSLGFVMYSIPKSLTLEEMYEKHRTQLEIHQQENKSDLVLFNEKEDCIRLLQNDRKNTAAHFLEVDKNAEAVYEEGEEERFSWIEELKKVLVRILRRRFL